MSSSRMRWPTAWPSSTRGASPRWARRPRSTGRATGSSATSWRARCASARGAGRRALGRPARIGRFVVVALAVFLGVIYLLGARARYFERKYELYADFTEVGGLIEGATVRLAGVQIGRVTRVVLSPEVGGKVRVTVTVARQFKDRIRGDSEAQIGTQRLLCDKLMGITP